jgi:hypothetical protein
MSLSNLLKLLGISMFLSLHAAVAEDEMATQAELDGLNSSQIELQAQLDLKLNAQIGEWMEAELDPVLAERMTRRLRRQNRPANRQGDASPAAMLAVTDDPATRAARPSSNTTCKMVGHTFECVLRDPASR